MSNEEEEECTRKRLKLVVVGDGTVGKTCLCFNFLNGTFPDDDEHTPTIFENSSIDMTLEGIPLKVNLWDTAGQEEFERLRPLMYPGTDAFLVCYAVNNVTSFNNILTKWVPELREHCPLARIVLVATKTDCRDEAGSSAVQKCQGKRLARKKLKADSFVECSAKTGQGVREAFDSAVRLAVFGQPPRRMVCHIV